MKLNEYQKEALKTWKDGDSPQLDEVRLALGVAGEAGEVAEKFKKVLRGDDIDVNDIGKELGDVLWYIAVLSDKLGMPLEQIARGNITKLRARQEANTIKGSGDNR